MVNDGDLNYNKFNVTKCIASHITASQPHTASTPKLEVGPNAHSDVVPQASTVAPQDPDSIHLANISIDVMTEAFATVQMPTQIGPNE